MATCSDINLKQFRISELSTYSNLDSGDYLLIIESGSALYSRKTTLSDLFNAGLSGSYTGSFTGSAVLEGTFTGSLFGSSSWSTNAISASHALQSDNTISASHALRSDVSISASHALQSDNTISASYALNSTSASHALRSDASISASHALTANTASYILSTGGSDIDEITTTKYFDNLVVNASITPLQQNLDFNGGAPTPPPSDGDWSSVNINNILSGGGVTIPVSAPKVAILNVYHPVIIPRTDRVAFGFFTSHKTNSYSTFGNYTTQALWAVGEDAGGGSDWYIYGGVFFVRLAQNDPILRYVYTNFFRSQGTHPELKIDLIGVQY